MPEGTRVGRFIILKVLGHGGMGVVYAAYDPELDRKVALKLLHPESRQLQGVERLVREAQAMARVEHPNVCTIFDVSTHGDQVFLAMEFIDGVTLHDWLQQQHSWREVLQVFLQAGQGLAAAHATGLVHRDFKPSNVLISKSGRVCVTDFGLARLQAVPAEERVDTAKEGPPELDTMSSKLDLAVTHTGQVVGTPQYMSPEQYTSGGLDARSDQFSFCAALYWALFKQRPFEYRRMAELASSLRQGGSGPQATRQLPADSVLVKADLIREPPRAAPAPRWLRRALMRGLALQPQERFASMEALLQELAQEPRLRRQRQALAAGGLLLTALVVAGVQLHRQSQVCSGGELALAGAWDTQVQQRLGAAFESTGKPFAQKAAQRTSQVLEAYARAWVHERTQACRATRVERVQTEELFSMQVVCLEQRRKDLQALTRVLTDKVDGRMVQRAVDAAMALPSLEECRDLTSLAQQPRRPADPTLSARVDQMEEQIASVAALMRAGQPKRALTLAQELEPQFGDIGWASLQAEGYVQLGQALLSLRQFKAGAVAFEQALDRAEHGRDDRRRLRALVALVYCHGMMGHAQESAQWARRAQATLIRLGDEKTLAIALEGNLGLVARYQGRYAQARTHFEKQRALLEPLLKPLDTRRIAVLHYLGLVAVEMGEAQRAVELLRAALQHAETLHGREHPNTADVRGLLAEALRRSGDFPASLELAQTAVSVLQAELGPEHPLVADELDGVGMSLLGLKRYEEARKTFERALELKLRERGPRDSSLSYSYDGVGQALLAAGQASEAVAPLEKSLAYKDVGPEPLAESGFALARALWMVGKREQALQEAARARARFAEVDKPQKVAEVDGWLASVQPSKPR